MTGRTPSAPAWAGLVLALAERGGAVRSPPLRLIVNRVCVAGDAGACLACDAQADEPCRNPGARANDN